jgi:hypothetical protein
MNVEADFMTEQLLKHKDGEISRNSPLFSEKQYAVL